jgi:hypothetical protein
MSLGYRLLCLVLIVLPACGGGASYYREDDVEPTIDEDIQLTREQVAAEERLSELLARPEPDCGAACEIGASICDLSTRICAIAERHPRDRETAGRCEDANERCEGARARIAERCTCE